MPTVLVKHYNHFVDQVVLTCSVLLLRLCKLINWGEKTTQIIVQQQHKLDFLLRMILLVVFHYYTVYSKHMQIKFLPFSCCRLAILNIKEKLMRCLIRTWEQICLGETVCTNAFIQIRLFCEDIRPLTYSCCLAASFTIKYPKLASTLYLGTNLISIVMVA